MFFDVLLGARLRGFDDVPLDREGELPTLVAIEGFAIGEDFEAGEKLSFDCRLRSRAFLGAIMAVLVYKSASPAVACCLTQGLVMRAAVASNIRAAQVLLRSSGCRYIRTGLEGVFPITHEMRQSSTAYKEMRRSGPKKVGWHSYR